MNEDTDCACWYSKHQMILNLVKDPFLAFFLVYFSKNGAAQIGLVFAVLFGYFFIELRTLPMLKKSENARNLISMGIYSLATLFFLILVFLDSSLGKEDKEKYIGLPLIVLVSLLIISNYVISMMDTVKSIRRRCTTKRKFGNMIGPDGETVPELAKGPLEEGLPSKQKNKVTKHNSKVMMKSKKKLRVQVRRETG